MGNAALQCCLPVLAAGSAEVIAFGRAFVTNLQLVARFEQGLSLAGAGRDAYYNEAERGYTTWPTAGR